jgi:hypothetical protein
MTDLEKALEILRKEGKDKPELEDIFRVISELKGENDLKNNAWSDDDFLEIIRKNGNFTDTTKKLYERNLGIIQRDIWDTSLWNIIMNPDEYEIRLDRYMKREGRIYETLSIHSRDAYVVVLCSLMTHSSLKTEYKQIYEKWDKLFKANKREIENKYNTNRPTERQESVYVDWDDVIRVRDGLPYGSEVRLLLLMYTEIPPKRLDYHSLRIYDEDPGEVSGNYYIRSLGELVVQEYKTCKKYGCQRERVGEGMRKEMEEVIRGREYVFGNRSRGEYGRWANGELRKVFGRGVTITTLRHVYISRRDLLLESRSGKEQEDVSKRMGHSRMMQNRYSWHVLDRGE